MWVDYWGGGGAKSMLPPPLKLFGEGGGPAPPAIPTPMYYEPENEAQSRQWVAPGSPRPKKFKTQPSAGKAMATVFWDAKGVTMLDSLSKRSAITGVYYANLLDQLRTAIRENTQVNTLKVLCCNRTTPESTLAKLQSML